jgi:RTX calcium-binding nonapeptide repeat (4 copies)
MASISLTAGIDTLAGTALNSDFVLVNDASFLNPADTLTGGDDAGAADIMVLNGAGVYILNQFAGVTGFETLHVGNDINMILPNAMAATAVAPFGHMLTVNIGAGVSFAGVDATSFVFGSSLSANDTAATVNVQVTINSGNGNDSFRMRGGWLDASDLIDGNGGSDSLAIYGNALTVIDAQIRDFEIIGTDSELVFGSLFATASGRAIVTGINDFDVRISAGGGMKTALAINASLGKDRVLLNANSIRDDEVNFNLGATLGGGDVLKGGGGTDTLNFYEDVALVTSNFIGVSEFEVISFHQNMSAATLPDALAASAGGTITVNGSRRGTNTLDASAFAADHRLIGIGGIQANNNFIGGLGNDALAGGVDEDSLSGGGGNDVVAGNGSGDNLAGGAGTDTLDYGLSNAAVTINLGAGTAAGGHADGDTIAQFERVLGSAFNDVLTGSAAANLFAGGGGADVMAGGAGKDIFDFNAITDSAPAAGRDTILDFEEAAIDRIDLRTIDANAALSGNNAFTFIGSAAFSGLGQVRVFVGAVNTLVEMNTNGSNAADMQILLSGTHPLDALDFFR